MRLLELQRPAGATTAFFNPLVRDVIHDHIDMLEGGEIKLNRLRMRRVRVMLHNPASVDAGFVLGAILKVLEPIVDDVRRIEAGFASYRVQVVKPRRRLASRVDRKFDHFAATIDEIFRGAYRNNPRIRHDKFVAIVIDAEITAPAASGGIVVFGWRILLVLRDARRRKDGQRRSCEKKSDWVFHEQSESEDVRKFWVVRNNPLMNALSSRSLLLE